MNERAPHVHVAFLVGARNRLAVMLDWAWAYLTYRRSIRLITGAEVEGSQEISLRAVEALRGVALKVVSGANRRPA